MEESIKRKTNTTFAYRKTNAIMERNKLINFENLFHKLDSDGDG